MFKRIKLSFERYSDGARGVYFVRYRGKRGDGSALLDVVCLHLEKWRVTFRYAFGITEGGLWQKSLTLGL